MLLRLGFSLHELLSQTTDLVAAVVLDAHVHGPDLPMTDAEAAALLLDQAAARGELGRLFVVELRGLADVLLAAWVGMVRGP
jgi:hypothetical protein